MAHFGELGCRRVTAPIKTIPVKTSSVVLIIIDALNAKHLGIYGYNRPTSPTIDTLASNGLMLSNYITNASWTRPSFGTIITGLTKREHKMELTMTTIADKIVTVAERFKQAGYKTAGFVGNPLARSRWGFDQGFETYIDNDVLGQAGFADDAKLMSLAIKWLRKNKDEKFFVLIFFAGPHAPYRPKRGAPRFYDGLPPGHNIALPLREYKHGMDPGDLAWTMATYDNRIAYTDMQVSRMVDHLAKTGLADRTSIIVTADHGEIFGQHNCFLHTYHMWEPVLRVPFIMRSPRLPQGGICDDRPYTHLDLGPTLLDLAAVDAGDPKLPGRSLLADLADVSVNRERVLFSQFNAHGIRRQAIRKGRWKLVHHHPVNPRAIRRINKLRDNDTPPDPGDLPTLSYNAEKYELYDLVADPGETKNLYEERKTAPETSELLAELNARIGGDEEELKIELDQETLKALQAAGYISSQSD